MAVHEWHRCAPDVMAGLYAAEDRYWAEALFWDTSRQWYEVERARETGALPGVVVHDAAGSVTGWGFHLIEGDTLHLGGLVADNPATTEALVAAMESDGDLRGAGTRCCFVADRAPGLPDVLQQRGYELDIFHYLVLSLAAPQTSPQCLSPVSISAWQTDANLALPALFQKTYPRRIARYFAPHDAPEEWDRYARNLLEQPGCGVFRADLSVVARDAGRVVGTAVITGLDAATAHVAQLAVEPDMQRQGLARRLMAEVEARAWAAGCSRVTLLVAGSNAPALALYRRLGFRPHGRFVAGYRGTPEQVRLAV